MLLEYCIFIYKKIIGNKKVLFFKIVIFIVIIIFFQTDLMAKPCTKYIMSYSEAMPLPEFLSADTLQVKDINYFEFDDLNKVLANSTSGDVICFKEGVYPPIIIQDIQDGAHNITLKADDNSHVKINNNDYKGMGIYINNSKNITISGFNLSGGLYGVYVKGSSNINLINNTIYNVGQEAIIVKSGISKQKLSNFIISNNLIFDTGKANSQYGEGIYIGDGNENFNEIIDNVIIDNNYIKNTMNEAIDIKINAKHVVINLNTIINTNLKFNGAITVATSDRHGADSDITISHNIIKGVENRSGYRPIGIAVGQGNTIITGNIILEDSTKFVGICLYSTFVNSGANTVMLGSNDIITNGQVFLPNCGNGGSNAFSPANVMRISE